MTAAEMWAAVIECDGSYDGKFFYGVQTVGVYCHPSCRSKKPNRENIRFFSTKKEASSAGFVPCKRCRPDVADYNPTLELAQKAKKIIDEYYYERKLLADVMKNMGVTSGHLSVIFKSIYGVPPIQYLHQVRLDHAKYLLAHTDLPIIEIAGDIGFESLPAFYYFFKKHAATTPKTYRFQVQKQLGTTENQANR